MEITPYLLWLNGFEEDPQTQIWTRINPGNTAGANKEKITCRMMVQPTMWPHVWKVQYEGPGHRYIGHIGSFQDLMAISEAIAHNSGFYTTTDPIEVYVPEIYTADQWFRGDYDQSTWDSSKHVYSYASIWKHGKS